MLRIGSALLILLAIFNLTGCGTEDLAQVPIKDAWRQPLRKPVTYIVHPGDSLYSIAWLYGLDYKQIAQDNHIAAPYHIRAGQKLRLRPQSSSVAASSDKVVAITANSQVTAALTQEKLTSTPAATPATTVTDTEQNKQPPVVTTDNTVSTATMTPIATPAAGSTNKVAGITWTWPAQGKIVNGFAPANLNRGVDIAGKLGAPVNAAAAGRVVYAGNGLRGYGQLIIIKHNDDYLSAYAHNQKLLVKEGQTVRLGQQIATLGATEAKSPTLHFEIRQNGKPIDPLKYLPSH